MPEKTSFEAPMLARSLEVDGLDFRAEDGNKLTFAASSETPVERWFGDEVLSHEKSAIRMDRVKRGAMPLLFNHNWDRAIGMIDAARIEGGRLMVDAHLFADDPDAEKVGRMIAGGLRNVSIGYRIHTVEENTKTQRFTVTDWEPYEISIVTVPADTTVGIGRSGEQFEVRMIRASNPADNAITKETREMSKDNTAPAGDTAEPKTEVRAAEPRVEVRSAPPMPDAAELERKRIADIKALCEKHNLNEDYQRNYIGAGFTAAQVGLEVLKVLEERGKANPQPLSKIGLTDREANRFSLARAIVASLDKDWKHAGFEREVCIAAAERTGKNFEPGKFVVPFEVMERRNISPFSPQQMVQMGLTRAQLMDVQLSSGAGGYLIGTDNVGFIEALYNRTVALRMGARRLSGLVGNVTVPRMSASASATWLSTDASSITDTGQTFVQMSLTPHNVGALTRASRQLIMQSQPAADGIIANDLANVVAVAADLAVLHGSNSGGQPQGLVGTSGVGSVASTGLDYGDILGFQEDVATANVTPMRGGYVTTVALASLAKQRQRFTSTDTPLWVGNIWEGSMEGFPAMSSNQVSAGYVLFGDWQELIFAEWGVLEIEVNPYDTFAAGIIGIRAMYSMDVGVRRPAAFSVASGVVA